jgi:multidrug efflux pump subunit AcrB
MPLRRRTRHERKRFNLSALAVRERSVTLFLIVLVTIAGIYAFFGLGRAEDPPFTVKQMTAIAVWPGATAQEMQDQVAEPLEKRLQELKWYDRTETYTRPAWRLSPVVAGQDPASRSAGGVLSGA